MKNNAIQKLTLLVLLAFLWGASYPLTKVSVDEIPTMTYSLGRTAIGALILWLMLRLKGQRLPGWDRVWFHIAVMALVHSAAPYVLIAWGSLTLDSGLTAIITSTAPLFTIILAHFLVADDRLTPAKLFGVFVAFSGMIVLLGPAFSSGVTASLGGVIAVLASSICYGVANVYTRKYLRGLSSLAGPAAQLIVATAFLLPVSLLMERPYQLPLPSGISLLAWVVAAVLCTAVAFIIFYRLMEMANPSFVGMVSYLIPIVGAVLGVVVLGEQLSWNAYLGFGIILAGVMITNGLFNQPLYHIRYHFNLIIHSTSGALARKGDSREPVHT